MKNTVIWLSLFSLLLLQLAACVKKVDSPNHAARGVYLVNEGNFNFGNAEITFYEPATRAVSNNLFQSANSFGLGDVAQSMYAIDSIGFIVVNNSAKIEVVRLPSLQKLSTISIPGSSPRYLLPLDDSIAYVTDLYAGKIHVVNYRAGTLVKQITGVPGWTEHLIRRGADVWVEGRNYSSAHASSAKLLKLNTANHTLAQTFTITGSNLNGLVLDKNAHLWLAVEEDTAHAVPSSLICLDENAQQFKKLDFSFGHHPSNLCINSSSEQLYYLDKGVFTVGITEAAVSTTALIGEEGRNLYGLGVDPGNGDVYVSDALDYVQPAVVFRYSSSGVLLHTFHAGLITGNFCFTP